ncbi:MAG: hypothetical protein H7124_05750 [Phycisphaerales bacterium]|nr:hypothetical protein [Hyphomonadaceae bacterium]
MTSAQAPEHRQQAWPRLERLAELFFAWRFALPAYLGAALLLGALWWRVTTWLNPTTWWPWPYFLPQLTISYADNGFTRRALAGTVADLLHIQPSIGAVKLMYAAGILAGLLALFGFGWRATRELRPLERAAALLLLALSPATMLHWVEDPGRLDAWVVCFAALAFWLASRRAYLSAAIFAAAAGLIHESFFVVFGFLVLIVADERRRQGAIGKAEFARACAALLGLAALFAYLLFYGSADFASLQQSAAQLGQEVEIDGFNLYYSYLGFEARPHAWAACFMRNDPARAADLALTMGFLSLQAFALFAWSDRLRLGLAQLALLGPAALAFIALDIGRYAAFASIGLWLYFFMAVRTDRPDRVFTARRLLLLAALTALGPLGVTDGYQSLKGILDSIFGAHSPQALGAICNADLR